MAGEEKGKMWQLVGVEEGNSVGDRSPAEGERVWSRGIVSRLPSLLNRNPPMVYDAVLSVLFSRRVSSRSRADRAARFSESPIVGRFLDAICEQLKLRGLSDPSTTKGRFCHLTGRLFKSPGLTLTGSRCRPRRPALWFPSSRVIRSPRWRMDLNSNGSYI
jgi:hypothetical protein